LFKIHPEQLVKFSSTEEIQNFMLETMIANI